VVTDGNVPFRIGKGVPMRRGSDALLVTTGITLKAAQDAGERLAEEGVQCAILHMPTIKPFDREVLLELSSPVQAVVSVEESTILGGLGGAVAEAIAEAGFSPAKRFRRVGIPDVFPDHYGSQATLLDHYCINADGIVAAVRALLDGR
jgi:transketolase